jgi:hypothetical protein
VSSLPPDIFNDSRYDVKTVLTFDGKVFVMHLLDSSAHPSVP